MVYDFKRLFLGKAIEAIEAIDAIEAIENLYHPLYQPVGDPALLGIGFAERTVLLPLRYLAGKPGKGLAGFAQAVMLAGRGRLVHAQMRHGTGEVGHLPGIVAILHKHAKDSEPLLLLYHQFVAVFILCLHQLLQHLSHVAIDVMLFTMSASCSGVKEFSLFMRYLPCVLRN